MKKYLLFIATSFALFIAPVVSNAADWTIGVTMSSNSLDTAGSEDVDSNGTIDATKNVSDDFLVGSLFLETTMMGDKYGMTVGVDYIPFDADIDKRSITQSTLGAKADGAASSGTNSVSGSVEAHRTIYLQPGMSYGNGMIYATVGYVTADLNAKSVSITHTNKNETKSLDGTKIGVGYKAVSDSGLVLKFDFSETDYDEVSFTTSNNTTAKADLDNTALAISIGKQF